MICINDFLENNLYKTLKIAVLHHINSLRTLVHNFKNARPLLNYQKAIKILVFTKKPKKERKLDFILFFCLKNKRVFKAFSLHRCCKVKI